MHITSRLKAAISNFLSPSDVSALHSQGVCYCVGRKHQALRGAMNTVNEGHRYRKHIIVRLNKKIIEKFAYMQYLLYLCSQNIKS